MSTAAICPGCDKPMAEFGAVASILPPWRESAIVCTLCPRCADVVDKALTAIPGARGSFNRYLRLASLVLRVDFRTTTAADARQVRR